MILYADRGCPSAHRVRALLDHLQLPVELREAPPGHKPDGVLRHSAAGRLPLFVDDDGLVLTESRVVLEHLAERHGFASAYPRALPARSRHRRAMVVIDDYIGPAFFALPDTMDHPARFDDALGVLEEAAAEVPEAPCLLSFHVAPFWWRFALFRPTHELTRAVLARPALRAFLEQAVALPSVQRTMPDPRTHAEDFRLAREAGLFTREIPSPALRTP